jgi:hypothetical protein
MANSKVKFLQNSAGSYGLAHEGDEVIVKSSVAKELEKAGIAEISGDTDEDETIPQAGSVGGDKTSPTLSGGKATKKAEPVDTISTKTGTKKTSKK